MGAGSEALRRAWEHDSAGREAEAVVQYRAAFEAGIDDEDPRVLPANDLVRRRVPEPVPRAGALEHQAQPLAQSSAE